MLHAGEVGYGTSTFDHLRQHVDALVDAVITYGLRAEQPAVIGREHYLDGERSGAGIIPGMRIGMDGDC